MKKVTYISRSRAQSTLPPENSVIISLHDASEDPASLLDGWKDRLTLCFHDADEGTLGLTLFNQDMAKQILKFVQEHSSSAEELVVHCQMGVSRSAAVAMFLSEVLEIPCYMGDLRVSFATYKNYNKLVYRTLYNELTQAPEGTYSLLA